jgi:serine/threonine protein kinase
VIDRLEGKTLGDYHILEKVGQGGMTTVYKALDLPRSRVVALKVLSPYIAQDPGFKARFEREVEVLEELHHPNIVPILDFGETDIHAYLVMPFMHEGTLQDRMRRGAIDPFEIARMVSGIGEALAFAHERGVIHRDVKPSNILVDGDGNVLLSDFGFAHVDDLSVSLTGSALIGTPAYMSPEQCRGDKLDARSDQYSLGIVLYQLFTGRLPYEGDTPMAVAVQHINEPLPGPRRANPDLPKPVAAVIVKALSKDPEQRYPTIMEMNDAFQAAVRESVDAFGHFIPTMDHFDLITWITEETPLGRPIKTLSWMWRTRRPALVSVMLLLLMLPTAGYALASLGFEPDSQPIAALSGGGDQNLQATIDALSTSIAAGASEGLDPSMIEAAVAATLSASSRQRSGRPTATPGLLQTLAADQAATRESADGPEVVLATPTEQSSGGGGGGNSGGSGTDTPTATPSRAASPNPTSVQEVTPTAMPSPTSTPPPTATLVPTSTPIPPTTTPAPRPTINPKACKDNRDHTNYCTPVPGA